MRRVALVGWHPPESDAVAAERVGSFLQYLSGYGWDPVFVTSAHSPRDRVEARHVVRDPAVELRAQIQRLPAPIGRRVWRAVVVKFGNRANASRTSASRGAIPGCSSGEGA